MPIPTNGRYAIARAPIKFGGTTTPFLPNGISLIDRESLEQARAGSDEAGPPEELATATVSTGDGEAKGWDGPYAQMTGDGMHWVTIGGHHVKIRDSKGKRAADMPYVHVPNDESRDRVGGMGAEEYKPGQPWTAAHILSQNPNDRVWMLLHKDGTLLVGGTNTQEHQSLADAAGKSGHWADHTIVIRWWPPWSPGTAQNTLLFDRAAPPGRTVGGKWVPGESEEEVADRISLASGFLQRLYETGADPSIKLLFVGKERPGRLGQVYEPKGTLGEWVTPPSLGKPPRRRRGREAYTALEQARAGADDCQWVTLPDGRHICINPAHVNVVHTDNVDVALRALAAGKKVILTQKREVATLLDKLAEIARDAEAKGRKAPNYDLCNVSVTGTNLFCAETKGIPRLEMPQLNGKPIAGSLADRYPKDQFGNVTIAPLFVKHLEDKGVKIGVTSEGAEYLRASQNELNGVKVALLMQAMRTGRFVESPYPMVVSQDNYIVDGHHRWAASVGLQYQVGQEVRIPIIRVGMPILDLLHDAKTFADDQGLPQVGVTHMGRIRQRESLAAAIREALHALASVSEQLASGNGDLVERHVPG